MAEAPKAAPRKKGSKKRERREVRTGIAHVQATFNNTIVTLTDKMGNVVSWSSAGSAGFKGSRKSTPFAAQTAAEIAARKAMDFGLKQIEVFVRGPGAGREAAIRSLQAVGLEITAIRDVAHGKVEKTVTPEIAARMEGHVLGARLKIPGIKILRLIGEGGMSRVYLASRESDDEPLVVKILRSEVMQDKRTLDRFVEEYNLVERVSSRHVARVHAHGVQDNNAYLVMEFCEGGDLNKRLGNKALPPDEALGIFRQLMLALGDIHEQGILHRDLKPQNLMFRADGSLAIVDFGVAKHVDSIDRTNKGEILGTPRYMSPEQVQGRALDLRTDIYSAGVLLYQMMLGQHLFEGETAVEVALHHLNTPPPALPERLQQYQRLFDKLLEKDRDARFRNADEVIGYLSRKFFQDA